MLILLLLAGLAFVIALRIGIVWTFRVTRTLQSPLWNWVAICL